MQVSQLWIPLPACEFEYHRRCEPDSGSANRAIFCSPLGTAGVAIDQQAVDLHHPVDPLVIGRLANFGCRNVTEDVPVKMHYTPLPARLG
jgi:hypothetical protein